MPLRIFPSASIICVFGIVKPGAVARTLEVGPEAAFKAVRQRISAIKSFILISCYAT
jgi:hypothetical protein